MSALGLVLSFLGGILIAAIGGYFTLRSKKVEAEAKSGTTHTSEAETLWAQAQEMRAELKAQVDGCEEKIEKVEQENTRLRKGLIEAENKILDQRGEILGMRETISQLREDLQVALREVAKQADGVRSDVSAIKQEMTLIQGGTA